jgi:hypothetical protein
MANTLCALFCTIAPKKATLTGIQVSTHKNITNFTKENANPEFVLAKCERKIWGGCVSARGAGGNFYTSFHVRECG